MFHPPAWQYVATEAAHSRGNSPNLSQPNPGPRPPVSPCTRFRQKCLPVQITDPRPCSPQNGLLSELRFTFPRRFLLFPPPRVLPDLRQHHRLEPGSSPEPTSTTPDPVQVGSGEERRQLSGQQLSAQGWVPGTSVRPQ